MPGFRSHYLFGRNALTTFTPNNHEQFLIRYPQSYHMGLQGPDVFFYYIPAYVFYDKNIGNVIHKNDSNLFFKCLIDVRNSMLKKSHRQICDAYIAGFMGHYTLDCMVHPYIYYRTNYMDHDDKKMYDFGTHVFLETDIDNALLRHYLHLKSSEFKMGDTIKLSVTEHMVISVLLYRAIAKAFPESKVPFCFVRQALPCMSFVTNLLNDGSGNKKFGVRYLERCATGFAVISPMIPNDDVVVFEDPCNLRKKEWVNPWDENAKSTDSVYDLIDKATPILTDRIHYYATAHTLSRNVTDKEKMENLNKLFASLGDCSYDSGLPY